MKKVIRAPGSGKTKELMGYCEEENAVFVCNNPDFPEFLFVLRVKIQPAHLFEQYTELR